MDKKIEKNNNDTKKKLAEKMLRDLADKHDLSKPLQDIVFKDIFNKNSIEVKNDK